MAYIEIFDRARRGFDTTALEFGQFTGDLGGGNPVLVDRFAYDRDTDVYSFRDRGSEVANRFDVFLRDVSGGVVIESVYYSDSRGRPTLDAGDLDLFVSDREFARGPASWFDAALDGPDTILGAGYRDFIEGGRRDDVLEGRGGDDRLFGDSGDDDLFGGSGNDRLSGGADDDLLYGGAGRDRMHGGTGEDVFVFRSVGEAGRGDRRDRILDFDRRDDLVDVSGIDADVFRSGDQRFDFIGSARFSGDPGELRFRDGLLGGDVDGDFAADFQIALEDVTGLRAIDVLL